MKRLKNYGKLFLSVEIITHLSFFMYTHRWLWAQESNRKHTNYNFFLEKSDYKLLTLQHNQTRCCVHAHFLYMFSYYVDPAFVLGIGNPQQVSFFFLSELYI